MKNEFDAVIKAVIRWNIVTLLVVTVIFTVLIKLMS